MLPRLYRDLADWYTLLTTPSDYAEEAHWYEDCLRTYAEREIVTVLELGCGAGANASFLKRSFDMVLVDLSSEMLRECEKLNPQLPRHQGDMRTVRLGRRFDAVFVHDACSYLLSPQDVQATAETVAAHLSPGGVALLCPDNLAENFEEGTEDGGHDGADGRGLRYLAWDTPGPDDTVITDYAYLLRSADGTVEVVHDRHVTGRLPMNVWTEALEAVGLVVQIVPLSHSEVSEDRHHVFVALAPASPTL